MRRLAPTLILALGLLVCLVSVATAAETDPVAQLQQKIARLEAEKQKLEQERRTSEQAYQARTAEVARLKAQPSSWGRDRKLQKLLAESKDVASALEKKDRQIREVTARIAAENKSLLAAIDRELAANPPPGEARRATLLAKRAKLAPRPARKIRIADETIDPLDDPEDLEYKADALAEAEKQLLAEEARLEKRATHYRRQAKLAKARTRAEEQNVFRDEQPRGTSRRDGAQAAEPDVDGSPAENPPPLAGAEDDAADPGFNAPPTLDPGRTDVWSGADVSVDPAVVLADVVDAGTLDELRRAERSGDPEARAKAAERARKEVQARIETLKQRRLEMERRARKLRGE